MVDRQKVKEYRRDLEAALREVVKKHGFASASIGTISFSDTEITCRVRTIVDPVKAAESQERKIRKNGLIHGTTTGIKLGSTIEFVGKHYVVKGYTSRGHFLVAKPGTDKQYRISKRYTTSIKVIE